MEDYINRHLSFAMNVYGYRNCVTLLHLPAIENRPGHASDDFASLVTNTINEVIHYLVQKLIITFEEVEARKNRLKLLYPSVPGNKATLDGLLADGGFIPVLNECSLKKSSFDTNLSKQYLEEKFLSPPDCHLEREDLVVNHFWLQVRYNTAQMIQRNENFINPEIIQTMASSSDESLRTIFQVPLDAVGKLHFEQTEDQQERYVMNYIKL